MCSKADKFLIFLSIIEINVKEIIFQASVTLAIIILKQAQGMEKSKVQ